MDHRLSWGILGAGGIARTFTRDLILAGLRVAAVGSRSLEGAEAFGRELGIERRHASYRELCDDPAVDIVYVATPHPLHYENAALALGRGKHVLLEKPFTLNAAQARDLVELSRREGRFLMEAMWTRFLPTMTSLRKVVSDGMLGELTGLVADHGQYIPIEKAARLHLPELGGGALLDLGVYPVSFAHELFGRPSVIQATGLLTELGVDRRVALALGWEGGARASLYTDMLAQGPNRACVLGSEARAELDAVWYCQTSFTVIARDGRVLHRYEGRVSGRGMQYEALEAERRVREGLLESPLMTHADSVAVMDTLDAARAAVGVRYPGE